MSGELSRRNFLQKAGFSVAGLAAVGGVGMALNRNAGIGHASAAPLRLPYVKMDPDKAMKMGYEGYSKGG